jgi:hypothetical protein
VSLRCPRCATPLAPVGARPPATATLSCPGCDTAFRSWRGVVDLRGDVPPSCWLTARNRSEHDLVAVLAERFEDATFEELVAIYATAHALPDGFVAGIAEYCLAAEDREAWTVTYMAFCLQRYADRALAGEVALDAGVAFVLTPNKWSLWNPEPHVGLWGVQFLPDALADAWLRRRLGLRYRDVATLLRALRRGGMRRIHPIPIEDKHLNPATVRGRRAKAVIGSPPLRWASRAIRPRQPTLEVLCLGR